MPREIITDEDDRVGYTTKTSPLSRFIWFVLGIVNTLLVIRFLIKLFTATQPTGLGGSIISITNPLVAPFTNLVQSPVSGTGVFEWAAILAIAVYWLAAWAISRLANLSSPVARY